MDKTYSALDISRYIINYCNDHGWEITNLKLQKLLYYVQAYFLISKHMPCFWDDIKCKRSGPYVSYVDMMFFGYAVSNIERQKLVKKIHYDHDAGRFILAEEMFVDDFLDPKDKSKIQDVLNSLAFRDAWFLVERANEEDPILNAKIFKRDISTDDMKNFFNKHPERIFGVYTKKIRG